MKAENIQDIYELSPLQQGILFHSLYAPKSGVYFVQLCYKLQGNLNIVAFQQAWQEIADRHAVLRTAFHWENLEKPLQVVYRQAQIPLVQHDWREIDPVEQQQRLQNFLAGDRTSGFDLSQECLMRLSLIQIADDAYYFVWSKHHLILDGWSTALVLKEVVETYKTLCHKENLPSLPSTFYGNYIGWLQQQDLSKAEVFWRQTLAGVTAPTPLLVKGGEHPKNLSDLEEKYDKQQIKLTEATVEELQFLARQHKLTVNTFVQGAWALLLSRYSGQEDVVYGATVSGRPADLPGAESMVGLLINTLPVRVKVDAEISLLPWLQQLQSQLVEMRQYEYSPLVDVQGWSEILRSLPLFESILVFENYPVDRVLKDWKGNLEFEYVNAFEQTNYPLTVTVIPSLELEIAIAYNCYRFDAATITRMLGHLKTLIEGMVANPHQSLWSLPLLTAYEQQQLLVEWNDTQSQYPQDKCIHQLFETQVEQTPDAVALVFEDKQLTYYELNAKANQLARHLQAMGVGPEVLVGICVERASVGGASLALLMVVGLLAILKAGGAYVPLDPSYPQERLEFILGDAQTSVLLTQKTLATALLKHQGQVVYLDADWEVISKHSTHNVIKNTTHHNLAYVIYTSGSTGQPKGVQISRGALVNFITAMRGELKLTEEDTLLSVTTLSFDIAALEIYLPLIVGARLLVVNSEVARDGTQLLKCLTLSDVTIMQATPATWRMLLASGWEGNWGMKILCGGEALDRSLANQLLNRSPNVWNLYGPTETTIWSALHKVEHHNKTEQQNNIVFIGRPIANTEFYILDHHGQSVPVGVWSELHIGGVGLARGYLNQPELTAQKFIPNPFNNRPGARLYKTGDLARYQADGTIDFLGRIDNQVKVRGFRIELGEVEAVLATNPAVREAAVVVREDESGFLYLVAYYTFFLTEPFLEDTELRQFLKQKLPEYMVPSAFVKLQEMPLTPNGKIDRRALSALNSQQPKLAEFYVAPRTVVEEVLAGIWSTTLRVKQVGIHDNFFNLGGHSLIATQVISRIREAFKVEIPLRWLFEAPSVAQLSQKLIANEAKPGMTEKIAKILKKLEGMSAEDARKALESKKAVGEVKA